MSDFQKPLDFKAFRDKYQHAPVEEYPNRVCEVMPEPMVSVHVSTYQHAEFIRDCLDGVLMQETNFPFEIIIGEDESNDGTREICKEYADQYPEQIRLFLHRRENNIAIHGRPTGRFQFMYSYFVARGKYIATCEGDDYWTDPTKLQSQIDFMEKKKACSLSFHGWLYEGRDSIEKRPHLCSSVFELSKVDLFEKNTEMLSMDAFLFLQSKIKSSVLFIDEIKPSVHIDTKKGIYSSYDTVYRSFYSAASRVKMHSIYGKNEKLMKELVYWTSNFMERCFSYRNKRLALYFLINVGCESPVLLLDISFWKGAIRGIVNGIKG